MKILIVEDTEDSRILLQEFFGSLDHQVMAANDGLQALQSIKKEKPDLIVSDILMPNMDGYELCRMVKTDPILKSIPFIFYTATYIEERDKQLALSLGAQYFVIKPETPDKLLDVINKVMSGEYMAPADSGDIQDVDDVHAKIVAAKLDKKIVELKAEHQLLEAKERELRLVIDAVPMLISHVDNDLRYKYANKAYEKLHELKMHEIIGQKVEKVVGEDVWKIIGPYVKRAAAGEEVEYETQVTYKNGETHDIWCKYVPNITTTGETTGFIALINDITAQKKAQKEQAMLRQQLLQAQKMEAIGHLSGGIAHDFNNILAGILGYTELVMCKMDQPSPEINNYLKEVLNAGKKAKGLVSQMLIFSRGGEQPNEIVSVNTCVQDSLQLLDKLLPSSIQIIKNISDTDLYVVGNPIYFQQLIMNLCINARDAMGGKGTITLTLDKIDLTKNSQDKEAISTQVCSSCLKPVNGEYIALSIADTGAGIPKNELDKIFTPFYTTKKVGQGTGMGLAVVHGIVHEVGGHILLTSEVGQGTEFILLFSEETKATEAREISEIQPLKAATPHREGARLMVVDDEPSITTYLKELLNMHGYEVDTFNRPNEAIEHFKKHPDDFSLVITDYTMPNMTGLDLMEEIKQINNGIPIMLCTGYSDSVDETSANKTGIASYLMKPFSADTLLEKISGLMN